MSDTGTDVGSAAPVESAPAAAAPAPAAAPAAAPSDVGGDPLDTELPAGMKEFKRDYVEKIRGEAAKNRTAARDAQAQIEKYRQRYGAFDSYDDADLQVWQQMATSWQSDPRQAAETMRTIATNVLGDPTATPAEKAEAAEQIEQIDQAQTPQDVEKLINDRIAEHDKDQQLRNEVQKIETRLTGEGFAKGTMPYSAILWYATNDPDTGGSIDKALGKFAEFRQSVIDDYVQSVKTGKRPPSGASNGQMAVPTTESPKSIPEATERARAFLNERTGRG